MPVALPLLLFGLVLGLASAIAVALARDALVPPALRGAVLAVLVGALSFSLVWSPSLRAFVPPALYLPLRLLACLAAVLHWSVVRQLLRPEPAGAAALRGPLLLWAAGMAGPLLAGQAWPELLRATNVIVVGTALLLVLHQVWMLLSGMGDDLVRERRLLRVLLCAGTAAYTVLAFAAGHFGVRQGWPNLAAAVFIGGHAAFMLAWLALTAGTPSPLARTYGTTHEPPPSPLLPLPQPADAADAMGGDGLGDSPGEGGHRHDAVRRQRIAVTQAQAAQLARAVLHTMEQDRLYLQPKLTIAALAEAVRTPEHKVRAVINGALGFRNFTAFVNHYRLREAARRLLDPSLAHLPIASIALDLGYASLGPFNRAFRAAFGRTPSEFRQAGDAAVEPPTIPPASVSH